MILVKKPINQILSYCASNAGTYFVSITAGFRITIATSNFIVAGKLERENGTSDQRPLQTAVPKREAFSDILLFQDGDYVKEI